MCHKDRLFVVVVVVVDDVVVVVVVDVDVVVCDEDHEDPLGIGSVRPKHWKNPVWEESHMTGVTTLPTQTMQY